MLLCVLLSLLGIALFLLLLLKIECDITLYFYKYFGKSPGNFYPFFSRCKYNGGSRPYYRGDFIGTCCHLLITINRLQLPLSNQKMWTVVADDPLWPSTGVSQESLGNKLGIHYREDYPEMTANLSSFWNHLDPLMKNSGANDPELYHVMDANPKWSNFITICYNFATMRLRLCCDERIHLHINPRTDAWTSGANFPYICHSLHEFAQNHRSLFHGNQYRTFNLSWAERLRGRVIWITGAGSGIGRQLAVSLSRIGAKLILHSLQGEDLDSVKSLCLGEETYQTCTVNKKNEDWEINQFLS